MPAWEMAGLHAKGLFTKPRGCTGLGLSQHPSISLLATSKAIPGPQAQRASKVGASREFKGNPRLSLPLTLLKFLYSHEIPPYFIVVSALQYYRK